MDGVISLFGKIQFCVEKDCIRIQKWHWIWLCLFLRMPMWIQSTSILWGTKMVMFRKKTHVNELCKFWFTITEFAFSRFGSKQQKSTPVVQPLLRSKWNGPVPVRTRINQLDGKVSNMPQFCSIFCLFNERYNRPKKMPLCNCKGDSPLIHTVIGPHSKSHQRARHNQCFKCSRAVHCCKIWRTNAVMKLPHIKFPWTSIIRCK